MLSVLIAVGFVTSIGVVVADRASETLPYRWKSVQMVGGGFVSGIVFHPHAKDVYYARTDIGGAYRWNAKAKRWDPILDWLSYEDTNLMGVESIGLDPNDPKRLYLACGMYTNTTSPNAAILRSGDQGRTFLRADLPFKMGGNENGRGNGERLAVDPNNGKTLYLGTRHDGLWRSVDGAVTWAKVDSFPAEEGNSRGSGIVSVVFDASTKTASGGSTVYAAVSAIDQPNLLRSRDDGLTWQPILGEPTQYRPTRMCLSSDGNLFVAYGSTPGPSPMRNGAVWKLNTKTDAWTEITPEEPTEEHGFGYVSVSVQSDHPATLIASTFGHPNGEEIFRSLDGGKTWRPVFHSGGAKYDFSKAPYVAKTGIHWLFGTEIDPQNPDHAIFTTGYGGYETFDLSNVEKGSPTHWQVMSTGIEETVLLDMVTPNKGPHLVTGIGDYGGFVHWDLDKPSPEGNCSNPTLGNTSGVAVAEMNPEVMLRVGNSAGSYGGGNVGYTLDGGKTWAVATTPQKTSREGTVAISADGKRFFWTPRRQVPYWSEDLGKTWKPCEGLTTDLRVVASRTDANTLYALDLFKGQIYVSHDGGASFVGASLQFPGALPVPSRNRGDNRGGQDRLYVTPGSKGDLWIAAYDGLYHAPDPARPFTEVGKIREIIGFGFGKAAPGTRYPTLFLFGKVGGVRGVFRSTDRGENWVRINDDAHRWGLILQVSGDPRIFGRVYVGTHGRGVLYGDPVR